MVNSIRFLNGYDAVVRLVVRTMKFKGSFKKLTELGIIFLGRPRRYVTNGIRANVKC